MPTFIDPTPPSPPPGTPNPPSTADILRTAGHMGIGSAAGRAFAASLLAAAALARAKGAELSARMRAEAHEIQGVYTRTGELGTEHWASEAGRAFRKQLERHRDSIRDRAQVAENTAADIAAASEELAAELTAKARALLPQPQPSTISSDPLQIPPPISSTPENWKTSWPATRGLHNTSLTPSCTSVSPKGSMRLLTAKLAIRPPHPTVNCY